MVCGIEVEDAATIVTDDEKAMEHAEGDRRNSEEVHRGNRFPVIMEKGKPALGRFRISRCPFHPTRDRSLRDIKTEHKSSPLKTCASPVGFATNLRKINFPTFFDYFQSPVVLPV